MLSIENPERREEQKRRHAKVGKDFKKDVKKFEAKLQEIEVELMTEVLKLPNHTSMETPIGDESKNKVVSTHGDRPDFNFEPLDH